MTKKIGRNDPCPCGSGKKYKHCCLRADEYRDFSAGSERVLLQSSDLNAPKLTAYLESHNVTPILDYLIALQLNPQNNGKNLRLEHIGQLAVAAMGKSTVTPDLHIFKKLIDEEYPYDLREDIPINMYCETVVFHGGNYVFFPGLSTHCSELFRAMTESIYMVKGVFSEVFKREIYQGVTLLLELGSALAKRAGIKRMTRGGDNPREEISEVLSAQSYAIPKDLMAYINRVNGIDERMLDHFMIYKDDSEILTSNPERNPVLYRPIVESEGAFYFLGISNQGCAINNFILKIAAKNNCLNELVQLTQETVWNRIGLSSMNQMHWMPMDFDGFQPKDLHYEECLFRIDMNWVAYLCYAKDTANDVSIDGAERSIYRNMDARLKKTLASIRSNEKTKGFHIITLVVYSAMGEPFGLLMNEQPDTDYLLRFSAFDFLQLVQTEHWDNLSLVRYARTKDNTPSLEYGFNQPLDIYSLYKHKGESFYVSDEPKPDFMQIEPNEGCELIHASKEKLDFHGTPMHIDGRIGYIPVQRDLDYASIYKPLNDSLNAKCCESYSVPVWVRCLQKEVDGINPSSITDTVITAIAYWMDRLNPALYSVLEQCYKKPVEIDLQFDEETLQDKFIHHEPMRPVKEGIIIASRTDIGVSVEFDNDFIRGFLGADNAQERKMMAVIVTALLKLDDRIAQTFLDRLMPLGQAKMILMTEASNSPLSYPLWLNPPIYINLASSQMMLDLFPKWMDEKKFDITGRLATVKEKDDFLHNGVDVLLEKLKERVEKFESQSLLKRLISNHETLLFQRENNKMIHPAQIVCFGDNEGKRKEIFDTERRLSEAGLATRALIEYVAATQCNDGAAEEAGSDDIEQCLAIMSEISHIGGICDAIHLGVSEHTIEKLASGRYGIYDDDFNDHFGDFAYVRSAETINNQVEDFAEMMERLGQLRDRSGVVRNSKLDEIDEVFFSDWGVTYTNILQTLYSCYLLAMKKQCSVVEIQEKEFADALIEICPELNEDAIVKALEHLTLEKRTDYLTPPTGMDWKEVLPWIYNRELSFLRRPIVKSVHTDGVIYFVYGFRSCLAAGLQLTDLLFSGRLRNGGKKMEKLLGKFEAEKGRVFNETVRDWLRRNTSLKVWAHDVSMKKKGELAATDELGDDLGDIDVLAYDEQSNVVYSIECKNTTIAKNVREMKKEIDEYLGRGENLEKDKKKALVMKHLRRHRWLEGHIETVRDFVAAGSNPVVKSMMLTSEVIPTAYLRKEDTPLSILNFQELKRKGVGYLDGVKEANIDALR